MGTSIHFGRCPRSAKLAAGRKWLFRTENAVLGHPYRGHAFRAANVTLRRESGTNRICSASGFGGGGGTSPYQGPVTSIEKIAEQDCGSRPAALHVSIGEDG